MQNPDKGAHNEKKTLIIIACSNRKRKDEEIQGNCWERRNSAVSRLSRDKATSLLACRRTLAEKYHQKEEKDLGGVTEGDVLLLPAIERYDGNLYRKIDSVLWEKLKGRGNAIEVVIISALYGLLAPWEAIRKYELAMDKKLAHRYRLWNWWKDQGLGEMLCDFVDRSGASIVHDFCGGPYRNITQKLNAMADNKYRLVSHSYPGKGSGSDHCRGKDIRRLLEDALD